VKKVTRKKKKAEKAAAAGIYFSGEKLLCAVALLPAKYLQRMAG